jgi:Ca-activated chloride channel homolog
MVKPNSIAALFSLIGFLIAPGLSETPAQQTTPLFKADVRLVEVYATVFDHDGRYMDGLKSSQFEIRDNGELCPVKSFEPVASEFSCAILMDRTGSMQNALPLVKNAINRFIDGLRDEDWMAVYTFNLVLKKAQDFTRNKNDAKQAVLRAIASGQTALFDSISHVSLELSTRRGKKAIVAFTDGQDTSSFLNPTTIMHRAKSLGIPLYFIAQGEALKKRTLVGTLMEISKGTGGETFAIDKLSQVDRVFQSISKDLQHSYMLTYEPPVAADSKWRTINLSIKGVRDARIRARNGYYPN